VQHLFSLSVKDLEKITAWSLALWLDGHRLRLVIADDRGGLCK